MSDYLLGMFCFDDVPGGLVEDVIRCFRENGFTTDVGQEQSPETVTDRSPDGPVDWSFEAWYDESDGHPHSRHTYTVDFRLGDPTTDFAPVSIRGPGSWLDHTKQDHDVQAQIDALVEVFEAIAETVDPWIAVLAMMPGGYKIPSDHPPDHGLEKLPFAVVFGEEWFDHIGSPKAVLNAPVYETRALDTGSVLVRTRDKIVVKQPLDEGPSGSPEKHLFEGHSPEDRQRFVDPFQELEDGELATDPVLCEAHAPFEWATLDYARFPELPDRETNCHVLSVRREGDKLWEAHNGEFVRRLVDENGQPIGERPDTVPPEQEFVSTAIRTAYEEDPPWHLYRMDSLEDPSVFARLVGMDAVPEGESIWEDRETPVTSEQYDPS